MSENTPSQPPPPATPTPSSHTNPERVYQNGLIGFFDILGYQAFLEKNSPESAAEKVLDTLLNIDKVMPQKLVKPFLGTPLREPLVEAIKKINWLVFSDTVLLTLDLSKVTDRGLERAYWVVFLLQCSSLWKSMFEFGLPLRGAITRGLFLVEKSCFAGKPIVEAYQLASDLNCAGVAIASSAIASFKPPPLETSLYFDYSFPSKTRGFVENVALNLSFALSENQERWAGDIRQLVHESFWAHDKSVGSGVPEKIENTERLLRFLKMKWPDGFSIRAKGKT